MAAISRDKEQVERQVEPNYETWQRWKTIRIAVAALSAGQWTTLQGQTGLNGVTQAQANTFLQAREDETFVDLITTVNTWRLTS